MNLDYELSRSFDGSEVAMRTIFQTILRVVLVTITSIVFLLGCSSGGNKTLPVAPDTESAPSDITGASASAGQNNHFLLAYSLINIDATDPDDVKTEIIPARVGSFHLNILKFLEYAPCTDCFKIVNLNIPTPGILDVDIEITHPFASSFLNFTIFDVRGIMMFNGSHTYPVSGLMMSDSSVGDGELLNAEGFTQLFNGDTVDAPTGDFFRYYKGNIATPTVPNADLNGYLRHNSETTRNAFYAGDSVTRTYTLKMPTAGEFALGYAVDANWDVPLVDPVTNPMTQFPVTANCIEPWKMLVTEEKIGDGLTPEGGQTKLIIDVYDWQGKGSHAEPIVECPELFTGQITATFLQPGDGYARYEATISNSLLASVGNYKVLVSVEDNANASSPEWIDLLGYQLCSVGVTGGGPGGSGELIWAKSAGGTSSEGGNGITTLSDNSTVVTGMFRYAATFGPGEPNQTVLNSAGGLYDSDIFIARYNPDGTLAWAKRAGGAADNDWGNGITTLSDNSTVVTGAFNGLATFGEGEPNETVLTSAGDEVIFIARYNPDGTLAWAKCAPGTWFNKGVEITTLSDNSTVVTGEFSYSATFGPGETNETVLTSAGDGYSDIFIARYNSDGTLAWAKRAGGMVGDDKGYGITVLSDNSTVVTGMFFVSATFGPGEPSETVLTPAGGGDIFIARYNPDGTLAWAKRAGGADNDWSNGITTLSDNSTVLTGFFNGPATFGEGEPNETVLTSAGYDDIFIARYKPDGTLAWVKSAGGTSWWDDGNGITTLSDNSTVVTGWFQGSATFGEGEPNETVLTSAGYDDIFIARYKPDGTLAWAKRSGGTSSDIYWGDVGYGITTLSDNSTVVTGVFSGSATFGPDEPNQTFLTSAGDSDIFIARFEP